MAALLIEPITQQPPPPCHHNTNTNLKPTRLSFQSQKTKETYNLHLALRDKPLNSGAYAAILEACSCPNIGKQIHGHTLKNGFYGHEFIETKLLQMYGKCECLEDAILLFDKMPNRNLHSWTAILNLHNNHCLFEDAISLFLQLLQLNVELDFFVFPVVLKACSGSFLVELGRQIHGILVKNQFVSNIYVGNALIDMYGKCGSLLDAKQVLSKMPERDSVSWNSIVTACASNGMVYEALELLENNSTPNLITWSAVIGGFSQNGFDKETIELLVRMQEAGFEPNARTLASVLPASARLKNLKIGQELHGYITRRGFISNPFVVNGLVDVYRRCGEMVRAQKIFSNFSVRNTVSVNTMIVGYCENGEISKAKELFDQMEAKDIVSWNSMIAGYVENAMFNEALSLFQDLQMQEGIERIDSFTLGSVLTACAHIGSLTKGKAMHSYAIARGFNSNPFVGGALVEMYSKSKDLLAAKRAFDEVTERDTPAWNALIAGYARSNQIEQIQNLLQEMKNDGLAPNLYTWNGIIAGYVENGHHELAFRLFLEMQASNLRPDIYTMGIVLTACSRIASIERGKQVHGHMIRCGYELDVYIGAALVDMYAKSGSIHNAKIAFYRISYPNLVSQNALLTAYAMHGLGEEGIVFFRKMLRVGYRPDEVTFLSVLSSCVHAGSVETGQEFFSLMEFYDVRPTMKHYTCMVDLLSRAGKLTDAYELMRRIPIQPDSVTWGALLGGCVIAGNIELGEIAAKKLIELEPENTGNYILLANLYAHKGRWRDLARMRQMIKDKRMHKSPGCSWIEDKDHMHVFLACDKTHERSEEIYETLKNLAIHMKTVI